MKFALLDGSRREPEPGSSGVCPGCKKPLTPKCGVERVWHWAHKGSRTCDNWWEPETEWHRRWKNLFPEQWQEVFHRADDGELHIADVKTPHGLVIEFQHSAIKRTERDAREAFYKRLIWIVDCTRLKNDKPRIEENLPNWRRLQEGIVETNDFPNECFPKAWLDCSVPVLFDFDGLDGNGGSVRQNHLICLLPNRFRGKAMFFSVERSTLINIAGGQEQIFDWQKTHAELEAR